MASRPIPDPYTSALEGQSFKLSSTDLRSSFHTRLPFEKITKGNIIPESKDDLERAWAWFESQSLNK